MRYDPKRTLLCLAVLSVGLTPARALAAEVVRESFETVASGQVPGRDGMGWTLDDPGIRAVNPRYVEIPVRLGNASRGGVSFDLQRKIASEATGNRSVFELVDGAGTSLFLFQVDWSSPADPGRPWFYLSEADFFVNGMGLWSPYVLLDRPVAPGAWIHVDLTWDDGRPEYGLFVDGRAQDLTPVYYDDAARALLPDVREERNREREASGIDPAFCARPFRELLAKVASVRLGIHSRRDEPGTGGSPLSTAVLDNFVITVDEPWAELHGPGHDVKGLAAAWSAEGVVLTWSPPDIHGVDQQYLVYRRAGTEGNGRFEKLSAEPVRELRTVDATAAAGQSYRYSVTSVYGDGGGGTLEGKYPPEVTVTAAALAVGSVAAEKALYGAGQEIVVTLRGTADQTATFALEGVATGAPMTEVDDGVYVGKVPVPAGLTLA
ncbi:MAG: hypothetical protein HZB55_16575, partial [Deltaproteobacteria bacterium]|nr:hypothetical protein [Deltaproteobacteria bacterium]